MRKGRHYFTSESVTEGHPDKICDQISDAVLDEILKQDPQAHVACETFVSVGLVVVGGEITSQAHIKVGPLVRDVVRGIGYTGTKYGFDCDTAAVLNAIGQQSPDIAQGVDVGGAGDQGLMVGYACDETDELMPLPITLAHKLAARLAYLRKKGMLRYLGPDGKTQVTVEYCDEKPVRVDSVVVSCQHTEEILDGTGKRITEKAKQEIIENVVYPIIPKQFLNETRYHVNPTGKFVIGGPQSDTGMTGRKIIVDTYGGRVPHGGGAFSGKDPTKVDRSASYMARYIAKNVVAAKLAKECTVQLAYAIGVADPVSLVVDTQGTDATDPEGLTKAVRNVFPLTPCGIIQHLDLLRPIYRQTAAYGHFGRNEPNFTWEKTDKVAALRRELETAH